MADFFSGSDLITVGGLLIAGVAAVYGARKMRPTEDAGESASTQLTVRLDDDDARRVDRLGDRIEEATDRMIEMRRSLDRAADLRERGLSRR